MSIINIIANLLAPDYPSLFLVRTPAMADAEADGGYFKGEIDIKIDPYSPILRDFGPGHPLCHLVSLVLSLVPFAIIGGLSRLHNQNSTSAQQYIILSWIVMGAWVSNDWSRARGLRGEGSFGSISKKPKLTIRAFVLFLYGIPAIGGMVIVEKMINEFGICTRIA